MHSREYAREDDFNPIYVELRVIVDDNSAGGSLLGLEIAIAPDGRDYFRDEDCKMRAATLRTVGSNYRTHSTVSERGLPTAQRRVPLETRRLGITQKTTASKTNPQLNSA